jgi:hypothetical protein
VLNPPRRAPCDTHPAMPRASRPTGASRHVPPVPHVALPRATLTSLYWAATSRWGHVAIVCFIRFRCMLHMFYLDVTKVDLLLHMLQWLYTYVASVCFKCFSCLKHMSQVYLSRYCICCSDYTYILQVYVPNVSHVSDLCCKRFIWMLHIFQTYVTSIYSKCFICFRHMLQMCLSGCCSCYTHVANVYL